MVRHTEKSGDKPRSGQAEKKPFAKAGPKGPDKAGFKGAGKPGSKGPAKPALKSERIAKALARAGVASRREVERLVGLGKVAVNGRILDTPAVLVTRDDIITVDGQVIGAAEATRLWRYHKPVGLVTTHKDPEDRPTVFQHLPEGLPRVISIGRLDINSEGLLLLTNDGELSRSLELPANAWKRVYRARAFGKTTQAKLDTLKDGVTVDEVNYGPIEAKLDKVQEKDDGRANVWITVSLSEGKNREVRKVLEHLGLKVNRLIRLAYGPFQLGTLELGGAEEIGPRVIRELLAEHIAPENLPTGDKVTTPLSRPSRRPAPSTRLRPDNAIADPNKKPSRVRAGADAKAEERTERPAKKPGWAKAGPRPAARSGPPRERSSDRSDRPRTDRAKPGAPAKTGWVRRETGEADAPKSTGWVRGATERPRADGPRGPKPGGYKARDDAPRAEGGYKSGPKTGGYKARSDGPSEGFKPRGPAKPGGYKARGDGPSEGFKPRGPAKPGGYKARSDGPRPEGRSEGFKPRGDKPSGAKFGPRPAGKGPRPGGKPGGKPGPRGPRS